jgi:hypothetical protein
VLLSFVEGASGHPFLPRSAWSSIPSSRPVFTQAPSAFGGLEERSGASLHAVGCQCPGGAGTVQKTGTSGSQKRAKHAASRTDRPPGGARSTQRRARRAPLHGARDGAAVRVAAKTQMATDHRCARSVQWPATLAAH